MGQQIRIAQSPQDIDSICGFLQQKAAMLCLPRIFGKSHEPLVLGSCDAATQIIFAACDKPLILRQVEPVLDRSGEYWMYPYNGLCIEWSQCKKNAESMVPGRYYFETADPIHPEVNASLKRIYSRLAHYIKKTYPKKSRAPSNIYVGPDLAAKVEKKLIRLVSPNGQDIPLIDNLQARRTTK